MTITTRQNTPQSEKIILGIDPGTNVMGYGLIRALGNKAELMTMGVIDMRKDSDPYLRLGKIFEQVTQIIDLYLPDEMAIEAPFFGKNVQSMLKLGRSQGVASQCSHSRVCTHEDKDGHNRTGTGIKRAGSRYAEATAPHPHRKDAPLNGCHRCPRGSLLSLHASSNANTRRKIPRLERFRE